MLANYYKATVPKKNLGQAIPQMCKVQIHFMENVDGCLKFQFSQDLEDQSIIYLFVIWKNRELYEANLNSEYQETEIFKDFMKHKAAIVSAEQFTISESINVA